MQEKLEHLAGLDKDTQTLDKPVWGNGVLGCQDAHRLDDAQVRIGLVSA